MKKILLIDDEVNARNAIKRLLKENKRDITVIDTGEGSEAVKLTHKHLPNLILLDLKMPGLNGLQILNILKQKESFILRKIPVIILSGVGNQEIIIQAKKMGAVDYITKPVDEKIFFLKIKKFVK